MPSRAKAAPKRKSGKAAVKRSAPVRKTASRPAPASAAPRPGATVIVRPAAGRPVQLATPVGASPTAARPPAQARPPSAGQIATAQQAEERRKAATRKLFARIRSLEAILGADLRKRGSLLLSQAVDQWYAEATSATATDVTITNAARAVISQL